jgi:hypothetical protein
MRGIIFLPHLANVHCVTSPPVRGIIFLQNLAEVHFVTGPSMRGKFSFFAKFGQCQLFDIQHSSFIVHFLNASSMSITADTTYTASFPNRPDITVALDQVFKFDNFLDCLIGGIKANATSTIGTINPGSLCTQYLYAPQIHFNLAGNPIAFIGNSSNKKGEFSLIKIDVTSICLFAYIKDKATMDTNLTHGDDMPTDWLSKTDWKDFTDPIFGTLIPNFIITYWENSSYT